MSAQPQEGEQLMEGIQEVTVAASEQVSQIKEGSTNLGGQRPEFTIWIQTSGQLVM